MRLPHISFSTGKKRDEDGGVTDSMGTARNL